MILVKVSIDHKRAVPSADEEIRCFGADADPWVGSKSTEYTGPLCPMSLRVVLPFFSRIFRNDGSVENELQNIIEKGALLTIAHRTRGEIASQAFQGFAL